jgi:phosphoribosylanthranilate isomerase
MNRFRVKVCGVTRPRDALLAAELGADLIGLIFYSRSPRSVTVARATQIVRGLPPVVQRVGVFVDEPVEKMLKIGRRLRLDFIQLHGRESNKTVEHLQREGFGVIKAFSISSAKDYAQVVRSTADLCLLDHCTEYQPGGTGERKFENLVLAGGIDVDNLAEGVRLFDPLVVDVNSGVESRPGIKSPSKLKAFIAECDRIRYGT